MTQQMFYIIINGLLEISDTKKMDKQTSTSEDGNLNPETYNSLKQCKTENDLKQEHNHTLGMSSCQAQPSTFYASKIVSQFVDSKVQEQLHSGLESSVQTSQIVKEETQEMSIEPVTQNGCHNIPELSFVKEEWDDSLLKSCQALNNTVKNAGTMCSQINESSPQTKFSPQINKVNKPTQILHEKAVQTYQIVLKGEAEEVSVEQVTQNGCHNIPECLFEKEERDDSLPINCQAFNNGEKNLKNMFSQNKSLKQPKSSLLTSQRQLVNEVEKPTLMVQEIAVQTSQTVKEEAREVSREPVAQNGPQNFPESSFVTEEREDSWRIHRQAFNNSDNNTRNVFLQTNESSNQTEILSLTSLSQVVNEIEKSLPIVQENAVQTSQIVKEEPQEMSIEPVIQNGRYEQSNTFVKNNRIESAKKSQTFNNREVQKTTLNKTESSPLKRLRQVVNEVESSLKIVSENAEHTSQEEPQEVFIESATQNGCHNSFDFSNAFFQKESNNSLQRSQAFNTIQVQNASLTQAEPSPLKRLRQFVNEVESSLKIVPQNAMQISQFVKEEPQDGPIEPVTQHGSQELSNAFAKKEDNDSVQMSEAFNNSEVQKSSSNQAIPSPLKRLRQFVSEVESSLKKQRQENEVQTSLIVEKKTQDLPIEYIIQDGSCNSDEEEVIRQLLSQIEKPSQTSQFAKETAHKVSDEPVTQDGHHNSFNHHKSSGQVQSSALSSRQLIENPSQIMQENCAKKLLSEDLPIEPRKQNSRLSERPKSGGDILLTRHKTFTGIEVKHKLNFSFSGDVADYRAFYANIMNALEDATRKSLVYANRGDKIQLELRNPDFKKCINVILAEVNVLSCLSTLLDRLGQANTSINELEMVVQIVQVPHSGGGAGYREQVLEFLKRKQKHLYYVKKRDDQLYFAISLARCLYPSANNSQAVLLGAALQRKAGLTDQTQVTFGDVTKFEQLVNRKIVVLYHGENNIMPKIFITSFESKETLPLYLYLCQNHCFGISDIKEFLGCPHFCEHCFKAFSHEKNHYCSKYCPICLDPRCVNIEDNLICKDCNRKCRSSYCYEAHKKPRWRPTAKVRSSECDKWKKCKKCKMIYQIPLTNLNQQHECVVKPCSMCGGKLDKGQHKCYVQPLASTQNHNEANLIFFEFKTYVNESGQHVPFILSTKLLNGKTWNSYGEQCIVDFVLRFRSSEFIGATFISHHADNSLLLNTMIEIGVSRNVIVQNGKIVCIEVPDLRQKFLDSATFLPMPLAALPETFSFSTFKGFFPVRFISKANLEYVGPCPAPEFYAVEEMSNKTRQEFDLAYQLSRNCEFNFKWEAQIYCEDDVDILTTACVKLRRYFINQYNVDPFSCTTLLSFGMNVFCTKFLAPNMLAIPQIDDYKPDRKKYSDASIEWLQWVMFSENIFIQHALNKGVKNFGKFSVDGYSDANGQKVAWEFVNCSQNDCPVCFPTEDQRERLKMYEEKFFQLRRLHDVKLAVMREHTWNAMKKSNKRIQEFLKHYELPQPLTLQELSYENRNDSVQLCYSAALDEGICFVQVNSLFPYVMANQAYPLGHPELIFEKFDAPQNYFGLIKAVVYPPRRLYFPVLPYKTANGKTFFTLCRTCANLNNQQGPCVHSEEERAFTGVWVTPEFNKALQMGYKVSKIVEVWHFEEKNNRIFEEYIRSFVKGKQETLGFPPDVKDPRCQKQYVREFQARQGVLLEKDKVKANPAIRHAFECCLDDLWLEFGDRSPQAKTEIMTKNADFVKYMFSEESKVEYFKILSNKAALVQWTPSENTRSLPKKTDNIFVTAFTAAYGRLHIYNILEKLQEKVLYYDTDQVIYVAKDGEHQLEFGSCLGQLTDTLAGDSIREFASTGPKSYAYQTKKNRVLLNVKGITQTLENCEKINFSIKEMVKGYANSEENDTEIMKPELKVVYDQRQLLPNGQTLPFGY